MVVKLLHLADDTSLLLLTFSHAVRGTHIFTTFDALRKESYTTQTEQ